MINDNLCGQLAPDNLMDDFGWPKCGLPSGHDGPHRESASGRGWVGED
ncbi:hypothetical protein FHS39_001066 [Streptomyces olivoverticillatus]|uniref:Uncharacterized protein n=1 Tax=Streptomyces olivoverticillatus TaxID=66427 RepID=A0A7W7LM18_9ACTN|nr:hypothetical protein [Streptomyces olivoverticillatus]MBB4892066.1 hypothetical protein [Streptomyces olivoverticillatus]